MDTASRRGEIQGQRVLPKRRCPDGDSPAGVARTRPRCYVRCTGRQGYPADRGIEKVPLNLTRLRPA
jgi:hypothetical protein